MGLGGAALVEGSVFGVPLDVVLSLGDHGMSIVHLVIDALRQEAKSRALNPGASRPLHAVPWEAVLMLPGAAGSPTPQ